MIAPRLITPPAALVTLAEAKAHLRVDSADEDDLIAALVDAAVGWMDGWRGVLGRCIMPQTWATSASVLSSMRLPFPDVREATVSYLDVNGATVTLAPTDYMVQTVDGAGYLTFAADFVAPQVLEGRDDAVTITAVYGMDPVPPQLKAAAMMLAAHWFENREGGGQAVPPAVEALVLPLRVGLV